MNIRKKKGIGFIGSGILTIVVGALMVAMTATPEWVAITLQAIGLIGNLIGFIFVYPDEDK